MTNFTISTTEQRTMTDSSVADFSNLCVLFSSDIIRRTEMLRASAESTIRKDQLAQSMCFGLSE